MRKGRSLHFAGTYVCRLSFDAAYFERLLPLLSEEKKERLMGFAHAQDRLRSLFAELLLRHALTDTVLRRAQTKPLFITVSEKELAKESLLSALPPLHFSYGAHGKPALCQPDNPALFKLLNEQNSSLHFNLSHSGCYVACAVAPFACGVDIQEVKSVRDSLFRKNLAEEELADLSSFEGENRNRRFFEYWALKESFIKATGLGLSFPLNKAAFRIAEDGRVSVYQDVKACKSADETGAYPAAYAYQLFNVEAGYTCATATGVP